MSNDAQVLLVKANLPVKLRQAADAVDQARDAATWCERIPERPNVKVHWLEGSSNAGYEPLSREVARIITDRFEEFVNEANLRIATRAATLCEEIGLVD